MSSFKEGDSVAFKKWPALELLIIGVNGDNVTVLSIGNGTDEKPGTFGILSTCTVPAALLIAFSDQ